jgi:hypothetical protein
VLIIEDTFIYLCVFGGFVTITNCSVYRHGLFKIVSKLDGTSLGVVLVYRMCDSYCCKVNQGMVKLHTGNHKLLQFR